MKQEGSGYIDREGWVQVADANGAMEASLIVEYLRAEGLRAVAWQEGAGRALGLTSGPLGFARVMVPESEAEEALALLEVDESTLQYLEEEGEEEVSDLTKALLGATALVISPIGAGIAVGLSYFMGSDLDEHSDGMVDCRVCGTSLELNSEEIEQGWFTCPECQSSQPLAVLSRCPSCHTELQLDDTEIASRQYVCPECGQEVHLK